MEADEIALSDVVLFSYSISEGKMGAHDPRYIGVGFDSFS